ncbi:MAG: class F sortase [Bacteroidota bacterium]
MKRLLKQKSILVILIVVVISIATISVFSIKNSNDSLLPIASTISPVTPNKIELSNITHPVRIKIPSIKVDASIENVGLTKNGLMDSPIGPDTVGWFHLGTMPGEIGSAVMDGHSGWVNNQPAVFDDLYKLKKGDEIQVENSNGVTITFVVREIKKYSPKADASNVFYSDDGGVHLNLITCTGFWNTILKSRSQRLIVFTDLKK